MRWKFILSILALVTMLLAACASPTPVVEKEVVVTATPAGPKGSREFPTGRFVHEHLEGEIFEFYEDGTYRYYWSADHSGEPTVQGKYGIGDFYSNPISQTLVSFSASVGTMTPLTATTNVSGEAVVNTR
jgi:hypothetical protein